MEMLLVCYELKKKEAERLNPGFFTRVIETMQGPYFHCELVFVKDRVPDALFISGRCTDGWPVILPARIFNKHSKPIHVRWFKFTGLSAQQELQVKKTTETYVNTKKCRMNMYSMIDVAIPSFVSWFGFVYTRMLRCYLRTTDADDSNETSYAYTDNKECKQTFCSEMISMILNEALPEVKPAIPTPMNISDMVVHLLQAKRVQRLEQADVKKLLGLDIEQGRQQRGLYMGDVEEEEEEYSTVAVDSEYSSDGDDIELDLQVVNQIPRSRQLNDFLG